VTTTGHELDLVPRVTFTTHTGARGEPFVVPDRLWRLDPTDALATVTLPQHLHWSGASRAYNLRDRRDRARVYEIVLREGEPNDLGAFVDGVLLVDLWEDLVLPAVIRAAWEPIIARYGESRMSNSGLSDFQVELANLFFSLPESTGFLLAGGGALIAQGIVPRPTEDLDFFTSRDLGDVQAASDALIAAATQRGWPTELKRTGDEFRRWQIVGPEVVLDDLAIDSPATGIPTVTIAGPTLRPRSSIAIADVRAYVDAWAEDLGRRQGR
jgi:hypothetical protein